MTGDKTLLKEI
jgi:hypothetical protein